MDDSQRKSLAELGEDVAILLKKNGGTVIKGYDGDTKELWMLLVTDKPEEWQELLDAVTEFGSACSDAGLVGDPAALLRQVAATTRRLKEEGRLSSDFEEGMAVLGVSTPDDKKQVIN